MHSQTATAAMATAAAAPIPIPAPAPAERPDGDGGVEDVFAGGAVAVGDVDAELWPEGGVVVAESEDRVAEEADVVALANTAAESMDQ